MRERILKFIDAIGLTPAAFEKACGLSNGAVSKMGDNTRKSTIDKVSKVFPQINRVWLLTGEGEMLLGGKADEKSDGTVTINAQAWEVIRRQSESLASRDRQIDELIAMLKDQIQEGKKISARQEGRVSCADAG